MPKLSPRGWTILIAVLVLFAVGRLLFPVALPEISLPAERIATVGGFPLTNSIVATWLTMVVLLVLAWLGTRHLKEVPGRLQNVLEMIVEALLNLVEGVAGKHHGRRFFPVVATIFLFILVSNWLGLLPGFGTIGLFEPEEHGHAFQVAHLGGLEVAYVPLWGGEAEAKGAEEGILVPFLRSANTDLNTPLALALVATFFVEYWGFTTLGFKGYGSKFINLKGGAIMLFVGIMELISEVARVISFTFRLFGNIFAGEVLLGVVLFLMPWVAILPFLGLELFVGAIQALVFALLTLAFGTMAVASHGEGEH